MEIDDNLDLKRIVPTRFKKYLITGGAGFIGSHTALALLARGKSVTVIDDLSTGQIENLSLAFEYPHFEFIQAKLPSEDVKIDSALRSTEVILHFAARVGVELAVESPSELMLNNLLSTEFIARKALEFKLPILVSSSSEVYGKLERDSLSECDFSYTAPPNLLRWAYSVSKISDEFIVHDYKRKGLKALIGRYFNFVGSRQSGAYGMVVPRFIKQAQAGLPITVYGDGLQRRTFCDVRDGVEGILSLTEKIDELSSLENIAYNIGGTKDCSILELALIITSVLSSDSKIVYIPYSAMPKGFDEIFQRRPNCDAIKRAVGWTTKFDLLESIQHIIKSEAYESIYG